MDVADFTTELNILLGDTDNFTFTPEEKTRALTQAFNDRYVVTNTTVTQTYDNTVRDYTFTGLDAITGLGYNTADNWEQPLASDAYDFEGGLVKISNDYRYQIPHGATLTAHGNVKVTIADTVNETNLQEYILVLAHYNTLKLLGAKKTNRFIKNDTNMNEIIALRRDLEREIMVQRQSLRRSYERS